MKVIVTGAAVLCLGVLAFVYLKDPSEGYGLPPCSFKAWTGYHCPGCGGTRSVHALLHGRLGEAFYFNPLFIIGLAAGGAAYLSIWLRRRILGTNAPPSRMSVKQGVALALVIIGTIFGFGFVRNMAWFPWLKAPIHQIGEDSGKS